MVRALGEGRVCHFLYFKMRVGDISVDSIVVGNIHIMCVYVYTYEYKIKMYMHMKM